TLRYFPEGLQRQRRQLGLRIDAPRSGDEAIDREAAKDDEVLLDELATMLIRDDAGAVVMRERDVVVLRQEAHWRRRVFVRPRCLGKVEELAFPFVAERHELWAQFLKDGPEILEPRPRLRVSRRRRTERGQVAEHDLLE